MNAAVELYNDLLIQAAELHAQHAAMDVDGSSGSSGGEDGGDGGDGDVPVGVVEYVDATGFVAGGANCWLNTTDNGQEVLVLDGGTNDADGITRNHWQFSVPLEEGISATLKGVAAHILRSQLPGHYVSIAEFDYFEGESEEPLHASINQRMDLPDMTWNHLRNSEWGGFKLTFRLG